MDLLLLPALGACAPRWVRISLCKPDNSGRDAVSLLWGKHPTRTPPLPQDGNGGSRRIAIVWGRHIRRHRQEESYGRCGQRCYTSLSLLPGHSTGGIAQTVAVAKRRNGFYVHFLMLLSGRYKCPSPFVKRTGALSGYVPDVLVQPFETGFRESWWPVRTRSAALSDGGGRAVPWQPSVRLWPVKEPGCIVPFLLPMLAGIPDTRYPLPTHVCGG